MTSHEEGMDRDDSGPGPGGSLERNEGRDGVVKVPLAVALTLAREKSRSKSSRRKIFRYNHNQYLEHISLLEKFGLTDDSSLGKIQR